MNYMQLQNEESLKAQHISDEEASRVVALWAEQQKQRAQQTEQPTVQAMAEGLDIPEAEVMRLLQQVREKEAALQSAQALQDMRLMQIRNRRRRRLKAIAIALPISMFLGLFVLRASPVLEAPMQATVSSGPVFATPASKAVGSNTYGTETSYERRSDGSVLLNTPEGRYEYRSDGSLYIVTPEGKYARDADGSVEISGPGGSFIRRADGSEERRGTPPTRINPPTPPPGVTLPASPLFP